MTNKALEQKVQTLEKEMARIKSVVFGVSNTDDERGYKKDFVKRILRNAKAKGGSVKYTNKKDFLKLV